MFVQEAGTESFIQEAGTEGLTAQYLIPTRQGVVHPGISWGILITRTPEPDLNNVHSRYVLGVASLGLLA